MAKNAPVVALAKADKKVTAVVLSNPTLFYKSEIIEAFLSTQSGNPNI